jgi:hypothetical protein
VTGRGTWENGDAEKELGDGHGNEIGTLTERFEGVLILYSTAIDTSGFFGEHI